MKKYLLREVIFGYDDEQMYSVKGFISVKSEFDNLADAEAALYEAERKEFQGKQLSEWEGISPCGPYDAKRIEELDVYLKQEFGQGILTKVEWTTELRPNRSYNLPRSLTIKQTKEIRRISTLKHFTIIETSADNPMVYSVKTLGHHGLSLGWIKTSASKYTDTISDTKAIPLLFESEYEAMKGSWIYGISNMVTKKIFDKPEDISDLPDLVKSLIETERNTQFLDGGRFTLKGISPKTLFELNDLLREKLFSIEPFPLDEMKDYSGYHIDM